MADRSQPPRGRGLKGVAALARAGVLFGAAARSLMVISASSVVGRLVGPLAPLLPNNCRGMWTESGVKGRRRRHVLPLTRARAM